MRQMLSAEPRHSSSQAGDAGVGLLISPSPALTVMASINWSLQECVPTTKARFVFLISLSTVLCCGNKDAQQLNHQLVGKVPSQTTEVQQALSYQPAPCLELGPPIPLPHMTHTSPESACLPPVTPNKASSLTPASLRTSLLLHSPACWRMLVLPMSSSLHPCLPAATSTPLHCTLLFLFQQPFPCTCGHPLPPQSCSSALLFPATELYPPGRPPGPTTDLELIGLLNDDF